MYLMKWESIGLAFIGPWLSKAALPQALKFKGWEVAGGFIKARMFPGPDHLSVSVSSSMSQLRLSIVDRHRWHSSSRFTSWPVSLAACTLKILERCVMLGPIELLVWCLGFHLSHDMWSGATILTLTNDFKHWPTHTYYFIHLTITVSPTSMWLMLAFLCNRSCFWRGCFYVQPVTL